MKTILKNIDRFFNNIRGWGLGLWILYISTKDIPYSFYGFGHYGISKKYADKRKRRNELMHYVLPAGRGSEQMVVFNSREMKQLKRLGLMSKRVTIEVLLRESYYFTKKNVGSGKTKKHEKNS